MTSILSSVSFREPVPRQPVGAALTEDDIGSLRYILDRTLQPLDRFDGFTTIDQFREAGWRYQLVAMSASLASLQVNRMPAFRGYLLQAQQNAIEKMRDPRVWSYWRTENLLGNLRWDGDPIRRQNIMYSGYWALALGMYERATGDLRFSQPGALTLTEPGGRKYVYDYPQVVQALANNFDNPLCFFACEPNWVFQACNLYGMTGMLLFDKVHGTRFAADRMDRFLKVLEREYTFADGRVVMLASNRTGLTLATGDAFGLLSTVFLSNMVSPRLAQVYWTLGMHKLKAACNGDLRTLKLGGLASLDAGNYQMNGALFWAVLMGVAREMGDEATYEIAAERYDALGVEREASGALLHAGSGMSNVYSHQGRFGAADGWWRFAHGDLPLATRSGPMLEQITYPAAMVAAADNDGKALSMVLQPGKRPGSPVDLEFTGLLPGTSYRLRGPAQELDFKADGRGAVKARIELLSRAHWQLFPN